MMLKKQFQARATAVVLVVSTAVLLVAAPASALAKSPQILMADSGGQFYSARGSGTNILSGDHNI